MERMFRSGLIVMLVFWVFPLSVCQGDDSSEQAQNVVLTPADQLILDAIDKVNDRIDNMGRELNGRIDKMGGELNGRIDNLWVTILGGFLGVMAFIGALVFWDRRTFIKRAKEGFEAEAAEDRKMIKGLFEAMKKLGEQFPQVQEVMRTYGLL